ncbi:Putative zinc-finger [Paenibacillus sp. 1_12]|uniref:anti-sigma factor n=1 Tax=Paenibacillus sp. 1_12 TaxID=1566278 RepID=UPI0008F05C13|nr:anti-sigma factor [Paenibacillus sp. 1_12]SFM14799.1 Putative zinc-finger [Paenibacillus sp. 1_12]
MSNQRTDMMCDLLELYALNGLTKEEAAEFKKHLKTCAVCRNQLIELQLVVDLLPTASEPIEVPQGMRERVLDHVFNSTTATKPVQNTAVRAGSELNAMESSGTAMKTIRASRSMQMDNEQSAVDETSKMTELSRISSQGKADQKLRYWRLASLALTATVIGLGLYAFTLKGNMSELQVDLIAVKETVSGLQTELTGLNSKLALASKPAADMQVNKIVTLNPAAENIVSKGLASIVIDSKGTHLIVQADDLPQVKQQEAFQVWLIKDNQPVSAGTFSPHDGKGVVYFTFEPKDYDTVAITLEPDANGEKPRGSIVLAGGLKS